MIVPRAALPVHIFAHSTTPFLSTPPLDFRSKPLLLVEDADHCPPDLSIQLRERGNLLPQGPARSVERGARTTRTHFGSRARFWEHKRVTNRVRRVRMSGYVSMGVGFLEMTSLLPQWSRAPA